MKIIGGLILDLSNLSAVSEVRNFSVLGENGASFSLEIKNEDSHYYNFITKAFQVARARLDNKVSGYKRDSKRFITILIQKRFEPVNQD